MTEEKQTKKRRGEDLAADLGGRSYESLTIQAPKMAVATFEIEGSSPYMQCRMSQKALNTMREKQSLGSQAKKGKKREPRDFDADYEGAFHRSEDGWCGIPAAAFRSAMIDVCRVVGFKMTLAKMSVFVLPDGFDAVDGLPLVRIYGREPERTEMAVRNQTGVVDIRARPMWRAGWKAQVRIRYDTDQFSREDVAHLLLRAGLQCGLGEGRAFSKESYGMGFGEFTIAGASQEGVA